MDSNLLKALDKLKFASMDLEKLIEGCEPKSFEEKRIYNMLSNLVEQMGHEHYKAEKFTIKAKEGKLQELEGGKFALIDSKGNEVCVFCCGYYIEVFVDDDWYVGRVEGRMDGGKNQYYFYHEKIKHPSLYTGMRARIRKE